MLRKNADVRQCSYFELGLHVITTVHFATVHVLLNSWLEIKKIMFVCLFQIRAALKGRYTLGDKLQQHVAATDHSMCKGRATSCSNMSRRHVAATNRFVCGGEFLWKSLSPQQNFFAATSRKKICGHKILLQRQRFSQNSPVHTKRFVCTDLNPSSTSKMCGTVVIDLVTLFREEAYMLTCLGFVSNWKMTQIISNLLLFILALLSSAFPITALRGSSTAGAPI